MAEQSNTTNPSKLVARLRMLARPALLPSIERGLLDAANEIERLRAALKPFADAAKELDEDSAPDLLAGDGMSIEAALWEASQPTVGDLRRARAALTDGDA